MLHKVKEEEVEEREEETYYDVLKVNPNATISEIVAAYHTARNAFSKESMATYSLFSSEETNEILEKLEQAYQTLSNIEKKREYDQFLELRAHNVDVPAMSELEIRKRAGYQASEQKPNDLSNQAIEFTPLMADYPGEICGEQLKTIREKKGIALSELARTTKIPSRYIEAIESESLTQLPARVYVQGFIRNLAKMYKIDPQIVTKSFMDYTDRKYGPME